MLETCQRHFGKELDESEAIDWAKFLGTMPIGLLRAAFDQWNRTGLYFPKMAQIAELVGKGKQQATVEFRACEKNGCIDGWVRTFAGRTVGSSVNAGKPVDQKIGAAMRCQCWKEWAGQA